MSIMQRGGVIMSRFWRCSDAGLKCDYVEAVDRTPPHSNYWVCQHCWRMPPTEEE